MSINNISAVSANTVSFRGVKTTKKGNIYNHSNAGLATGCAVGALAAGKWASTIPAAKLLESLIKDTPKELKKEDITAFKETIKKLRGYEKTWPVFALIAAASSIACGFIVDNIRNKKAAELADKVATQGEEKVLKNEQNLAYSNRNNVVYHSKDGKQKGAFLGLTCGLGHNLMCNNIFNWRTYALFALGGYICGAISDSIANKAARKKI